jgi:hypothetical protein
MAGFPCVEIPNPILPKPNAYDYYMEAFGAIRDEDRISAALYEVGQPTPPQLRQNEAFDHYFSLEEKEQLIKHNAKALNTLREGFAYEYRNPPVRSFNTSFSNLAPSRDMARLLTIEGQIKAARGDWGGAMNSSLDAMRMCMDIPSGGVLIHMLIAAACQGIARNAAWRSAEHLSGSQARVAAKRMEDILCQSVPYAEVLQEEEWCGQASLLVAFEKRNWQAALAGWTLLTQAEKDDLTSRLRLGKYSKEDILASYNEDMNRRIVSARLPYAAPPGAPSAPSDPVLEKLFSDALIEQQRFTAAKNEANNALLAVAIALQGYRAGHGDYPDSLDNLVPSYLKALPNDPFAVEGGLRYKRNGQKYVLYSIGPDGKDDGGKPATNTMADLLRGWPGGHPHIVQPDSKGDIVAGVNS